MGHIARLCLAFHRQINIFQELLLHFSPYEVYTSADDCLPCQGEQWRHGNSGGMIYLLITTLCIFMWLSTICMNSYLKLFNCLLIDLYKLFTYSENKPFPEIQFENVFSQFVTCLFIF